MEQHFDPAAERGIRELGVVGVEAFDVERRVVRAAFFVDDGELAIDAPGDFPHSQREGMNGAFHALQEVHADEADELLFAVGLTEDGVAALDFDIVFFRVGRALFRQEIGDRCVERERQAQQALVDLADVWELVLRVDAGVFVARRQTAREAPDGARVVVFFDVAARAGDRHEVEQLEIVLVHHVDEALHRALGVGEVLPLVKDHLRAPQRRLDARDALLQKCVVLALRDERDLVLDVVHAVVHRRRGEHEHARLHAGLDDVFHEALVARHLVVRRVVVAEVVAFVDDEQVVVAPVHGRKVDLAGRSSVAAEVGVVQHVVVEAVGRELVAAVVLRVDRPVLAQFFRAEHEHAVVAELVIFDDGQRLERLAEADAVRDDAAAVFFDLVDRAEHAVLLEGEELVPDARVAEARPRLHDGLVREAGELVLEDVVERREIDELRRLVAREDVERREHLRFDVLHLLRAVPERGEELARALRRLRAVAAVVVVRHRGRHEAEPRRREIDGAADALARVFVRLLDVQDVRRRHRERAHVRFLPQPRRAVPRDGRLIEPLPEADLLPRAHELLRSTLHDVRTDAAKQQAERIHRV